MLLKEARVLLLAMCAALSGCAANPLTKAFDRAVNLNLDYPDKMTKHVVYATGVKSGYVEGFHRLIRNAAYSKQGLEYKTPASSYRYGYVVMPNLDSSWLGANFVGVMPDHMPDLKENDIVIMKIAGGAFDNADRHFHENHQGSVILGIVCMVDRPGYEECKNALPGYPGHKTNKQNRFGGISTYPRYEDNAMYHLEFTPRYFEKTGELLPTAKPIPTRESYQPPELPSDIDGRIKKIGQSMERIY